MFILTTNMHTMSEPDTTLPVPPPSVRPYDPSMEFPKDMEEAIRKKVDEEWKPRPKELNLERDSLLPPHQHYAVISFVGPTCPQKHDSFCLKIKGVFEKEEEAKEKETQKKEKEKEKETKENDKKIIYYNIYV